MDGLGRNGAYTGALLQHIDAPDCSIETMFKRVRNTVTAATKGKQTTWEHTSLSGEFYFNLSLGQQVDEYDPTALKDSLFAPEEAHRAAWIVSKFKTLNWNYQNEALAELTPERVGKMSTDTLFVIGRNIYQSACGEAHGPMAFIRSFVTRTQGFERARRKALLDGILFEIFFDPKAYLRARIKVEFFNEAFALQQYDQLHDSFAFIAKALTAAGGDFYAIPGKGHGISVTVSTQMRGNQPIIDSIYLGGVDVLRGLEEDDEATGEPRLISIEARTLVSNLSRQLLVPSHLLTVSYTPREVASVDFLRIRCDRTVTKQ